VRYGGQAMLLNNPLPDDCTVYFVRHGQTDWNAQNLMVGLTDLSLNDTGRRQAANAGTCLGWLTKEIAALDFIAGPLARTRQTMEIVRATLGLDVAAYRQDERLKELDFGRWEGLTWTQIRETDPANFQLREADPWAFAMPGGESYAQVGERVRDFLATIRRDSVIVSHGGVCRAVLALAAGFPTEQPPLLEIPQNQILVLRAGRFAWMQSTTEMKLKV
jgi:broad specificity phosphatase PhoE